MLYIQLTDRQKCWVSRRNFGIFSENPFNLSSIIITSSLTLRRSNIIKYQQKFEYFLTLSWMVYLLLDFERVAQAVN